MQSRLSEAEIATFITQIENGGIDDIQIDVTDLPGGARDQRVREAGDPRHHGSRVLDPGIAPNKLLAKIASELDEPERFAFLTSHDLACRCSPGLSIWRRFVCSPWRPER
ncbi:hypothetical protein [Paraburkholderia sp. RL17-337-BIB-A]|uniref:hypothetical protein n=1 Tax=Paraburkholderia sp. RL17-337-BIB-A TaxID=3031636 RepID=UPI0038BBF971